MADERHDHPDTAQRPADELDRRTFMQGVGAAGVLGAVGGLGLGALDAPAAAAPVPQGAQQPGTHDIPRPAALRPGAQVDCRWPVTFQETIPQAVRLVMQFFTAWGEQNLQGMADVLHFPFAIFEQTDPIDFPTAADFLRNPPMTLAPVGMQVNHLGHYTGRIALGSYNLFHSIDVPLFCPVGAVVALTFMRYDQSGHKLFDCDGIYTVTNNDGRWGIELVSTIVKPTAMLDVPQADAEMSALRDGEEGMLRYTNRHVPSTAPDPEERFVGRRANVSFGYGPRQRAGDARRNRIRSTRSSRAITTSRSSRAGPAATSASGATPGAARISRGSSGTADTSIGKRRTRWAGTCATPRTSR